MSSSSNTPHQKSRETAKYNKYLIPAATAPTTDGSVGGTASSSASAMAGGGLSDAGLGSLVDHVSPHGSPRLTTVLTATTTQKGQLAAIRQLSAHAQQQHPDGVVVARPPSSPTTSSASPSTLLPPQFGIGGGPLSSSRNPSTLKARVSPSPSASHSSHSYLGGGGGGGMAVVGAGGGRGTTSPSRDRLEDLPAAEAERVAILTSPAMSNEGGGVGDRTDFGATTTAPSQRNGRQTAPARYRRYGSPQHAPSAKWEAVPDYTSGSRISPARGYNADNRRSAPRYRMVLAGGGGGGGAGAGGPHHHKTVAEARAEFAEKVANKGVLHLGSGYGTTFNLPNVPKAQLTAMLGGAGAVRHKGTSEFSGNLPPPRLVAYRSRSAEVRRPRSPQQMMANSTSAAAGGAPRGGGNNNGRAGAKSAPKPKSSTRRLLQNGSITVGADGRWYDSCGVPVPMGAASHLHHHDDEEEEDEEDDHHHIEGDVPTVVSSTAQLGVGDAASGRQLSVRNDSMVSAASSYKQRSNRAVARMDREDARAAAGANDVIVANDGEEEDDEDEDDDEYEVISYFEAGKHLTPFAGYATVYLSLTMIMTVLPLGFVGNQLGEETLAGASVGYFLLCMFAVYPTMGMMYALDTLCSHEYGRDPESDYQGLLLQRGLIVGLAFLMSVCGVFYSGLEDLLLGFYSPKTQENARAYLRYAIWFLIPLASYSAFAKFNSNQQLPHVPLIATAVGVGSMVVLLTLFVQDGLEAVMICTAASAWVQLFVIVAQTYWSPITRKTLGSIRLREAMAWGETKAYLRIAVPAAVFVAAETAAFDLSILLATAVSEAAGSAWSALLSYELVFVCVGGGFSAAACAKVGAAIGANQPINAKTYAWTALTMSMAFAIFVNAPFIYLCFDFLITTFGGNLEEASKLRYLFPFLYIIDTIQFTFQGIFGGAGLNDLGAQLLLSCLWGCGVPIAVFLSMGWWDKIVTWFGNSNLIYPFWGTIFMSHDAIASNPSSSPSTSASEHFYWGWFTAMGSVIRSLDGLVGVATGIFIGICVLGPTMIYCLTRVDWDGLSLQAQMDAEAEEAAADDDEEDEEMEELSEEEGEGTQTANPRASSGSAAVAIPRE